MEAWREAAALIAVFALLGAALWALRRRGGAIRTGAPRSLTAVERIALTPQHALHLIRTSNRELLVATHPHGCSLLFEQVSAPSGPAPAPRKPPFTRSAGHTARPRPEPNSEPPLEPRRENP